MKTGEKIRNYIIEDFIGEGGMGCVMKVKNTIDNKFYALKYCKDTDGNSISRFKTEVRIASETKHPNIINIIDSDLDHSPPYFIMPLAIGNVQDIIDKISGDFEKVYKVFQQICNGVSALHNSGKFHRDIKPINALILEDGTIVIADFGLAKIEIKESSTHTSSKFFLGTFGYHAPEQWEARNSDARTDIFQLGKCFYELYTSEKPDLLNLKKIPAGLSYIIQKATSPEKDDRYQSVMELLQALERFRKSLNPEKNPKDALENKVLEMKKLLETGYYDEDMCFEFLDLLGNNKEDVDLFIKYFDKIPNQILKILSDQLQQRFEPIFNEYTAILELYFKENFVAFEYAETVASKMFAIFSSTPNINFRGIAIRNTLRVANWCNRYNAMDSFNDLLKKVKSDEEAGLIAQILDEEIDNYGRVAEQVKNNDLHPTIVQIKNKAIEKIKEEEERKKKENKDWYMDLLK